MMIAMIAKAKNAIFVFSSKYEVFASVWQTLVITDDFVRDLRHNGHTSITYAFYHKSHTR
jgi:hypothetical protein